MLHGDIYDMQRRVKEEYPDHEIVYVGNGRYNVIERRKQLREEGVLDGHPLFSMHDVADVVFSFDHIPDMRVLQKLRDADLWRHPRGPMGWYDEMMEKSAKVKQKREQEQMEHVDLVARENHKYIVNEMDGMSKSYF